MPIIEQCLVGLRISQKTANANAKRLYVISNNQELSSEEMKTTPMTSGGGACRRCGRSSKDVAVLGTATLDYWQGRGGPRSWFDGWRAAS